MTRKLTILLTALMLIMGIGVSWADNYTITFKTGSGDGSNVSTSTLCSAIVTEGSTYLSGNVATATKVYHSGNYGLKLGTSSDPGTLKMNLSSNGKVTPTSIVVRAKRYSSSKPTKLSLNGETAQDLTSDFADYTFNITNEITYLELKSSKGTSGGAYCWIASITVNYIATPSATLESIVVSGTAADLWTADEFSHEGITVMANWDEGDPTDVTSACEYSGYDMTSAGEQTVTVSYTAGEVTKSDTYTVTVNTIGNTQDEPYTVAQAKALIDAGDGLNEEVYVEGIICQIDSYNSDYNSITYWISADGTTNNKFEVYGGLNTEGQDPFTSIDDLTVGYHAIVKGKIAKFGSTYEFSQNSHLVSYTPPVTQLPAPTNLTFSNLSMTGATLSWDAVEHASSYTVYVTGINYEETFEPTTNSIVLDGLTAGTAYLWTVKAIGDGVTYLDSEESGTAGFTTPTTVIYNINFETQQTGGTIEIEYEQAAAGEYVYAIATADYHYSFTQWNFSPAVTIYDGEDTDYIISFIMPASDVTVSATFTEDTKYTVTYTKGGDDVTGEDPEPVSYYENDEVTLEENPYTRTGYTFYIWKVEDANDTQYLYENATFEMPASNVTVTPYWDEKDPATITLMDKGAQYGGTINGYVGDNLLATLTAAGVENPTGLDVMPDYEFAGWAQAKNTENPNIATTETTIAGDITLYAVYANVIPGTTTYQKVSNLTDIVDGRWVIVNDNYALPSTTTGSSTPPAKSDDYKVTVTDNQISSTVSANMIWSFAISEGKATVKNNEDSYLYATNSNSGLRVNNTSDTWTFETNSIGFAMKESNNSRYCATYKDGNDWRSYTSKDHSNYGDSGILYLYKENTTPGTTIYDFEESAKTLTVTYDANGAEGEVPVEAMLFAQGDEYTLESAEGLSMTHHNFAGWKANTDEQTYAAGSKYTFGSASVTFTAQWEEETKYTVSCYANGTLVPTEQVYAGEMQLPVSVTAPNGYTFVGWTNQQIPGVAESATYFSSYHVTGNVDLYAVFAIAEGGGTTSVTKDIIDEAGLSASVTLNADNNPYQMGELPILTGKKGSSNFPALNYNATNGTDLRFYKGTTCGVTFATTNNSTITKIEFKKNAETASTLGDAFSANVGTLSTNVWTGNAESVTISYSADATYKEQMYIINVTYSETVPSTYSNYCTTVNALYGNLAEATTDPNTAYYISAAATVEGEVTINGVLGNAEPALLIINDGGQLIHHNAGVQATMRKEVAAYSTTEGVNDGWHFVASPMATLTSHNLNNGTFDLYKFEQSADKEWKNYESTAFSITNKEGYLYANAANKTIEFVGTLNATDGSKTLAYENVRFAGFNLIGNPFACNATIGRLFYRMNSTGTEIFLEGEANAIIAPCEGVFVQAQGESENVSFSKATSRGGQQREMLSMTLSQGSNTIDRAIIQFGKGETLDKFMLNTSNTKLFIPQNDKEFAAVATQATAGEMPVSFKASKDGTYTITVNTENVEANYLHLIDNLTGMDTDLLSTPSYTFDAKTSDYASRFKLVFSMNDVESNQVEANSFAYINNGEIIISNEGRATLQVIDVMGRIISSEEINGECRISTNGMTAGVYVLNLNGNVQKIVVR